MALEAISFVFIVSESLCPSVAKEDDHFEIISLKNDVIDEQLFV